jgi:hypothetical protein
MKYDELVNNLLNEAIFNSPYEKLTGVKRQIALEADRETQDRKQEKILAAAHITAEIMNEIYESIERDSSVQEPSRDDFIDIAFAALGTAGFDDAALQRAFEDPNMKAIPDQFTLSDFRKYHEALDIVFKDTQFKFLSPERIRKILKHLEEVVAELMKAKETRPDDPEDEQPTQQAPTELAARVGMSPEQMARLRAQGMVS